ncbi:MAG: GtrA family protein [Candidatus Thorarchaeota archaeon]
MEEINEIKKVDDIRKQLILYFLFAIAMILVNYLIQKLNQLLITPYICHNFGNISLIQTFYCSTNPYNMPELIGSIFAVGITYITKFILDKFIVFKRKKIELKETSKEFFKYFGFAIITTIINIGIQFILTNFFKTPLEISVIVALSIGYFLKFLLDRKYVFNKEY